MITVSRALPLPGIILGGKLLAADFNSTADQAIPIVCPTASYTLQWIRIINSSADLSTSVVPAGGIYTATSKGGLAVVAAATVYSGITNNTANTANNSGDIGTLKWRLTAATLYFSLTTAHGTAATADIYAYIQPY